MGFKKINQFQLISDGVMIATSTLQSATQNVQNLDNLGIQFKWTGTPTGVLSVWASADGANFFQITDFDQPISQPAGSASITGTNINQFPWFYFYVKYVNASGTGLLNVWYNGKDLN